MSVVTDRIVLATLGVVAVLIHCANVTARAGTASENSVSAAAKLREFSHVTVGVSDLEASLELWVGTFGLEVVRRRQGADPSLSDLWQIDHDAITGQALLRSPGHSVAGLHLVEFRNPVPPVDESADKNDWGIRSLVVYSRNLDRRFRELEAAGHRFGDPSWLEFAAGPKLTVREIRLRTPNETPVMLVEHVGADYALGDRSYLGIGRLVTIVPNAARESEFYRQVLNLDQISKARITGPELERTFGFPPGAVLKIEIVGEDGSALGRIEAAERQDTPGRNLFPKSVPPAIGISHVTYQTENLDWLVDNLKSAGSQFTDHGTVAAIFGSGSMISLHTPAGLRVEIQEIGGL